MENQYLPLSGVRVVDLTTTVFGPYTTQILGDFGADVIKIESINGDTLRYVGPARSKGMGALFLGFNRNKRSVVLDLKEPLQRRALSKIIESADILVHNMRPGKIDKIGFDPETVRKLNPKLVFASLHGYGESGPYATRPAYDDVIQGESGGAALFEARDGSPAFVPSVIVDKGAANIAANGILGAYISRLRTGMGGYVEIPMFEAMVSFHFAEHQYGHVFDPPEADLGYPRTLSKFRRPYKTADGYLCVLAYTDKQWQNFWTLTSSPECAQDPRFATMAARSKNINELYEIVGFELSKKPNAFWLTELNANGIPVGAVNGLEAVKNDPHIRSVELFKPIEHSSQGHLTLCGSPIRFNKMPNPIQTEPPCLGAHTDEVLAECGLSAEDLAAIRAKRRDAS